MIVTEFIQCYCKIFQTLTQKSGNVYYNTDTHTIAKVCFISNVVYVSPPGVVFSLGEVNNELQPYLLGIKNVTKGMVTTPNGLFHPQQSASTTEPLLQTICHHAHCSKLAGKTLLFIGAGPSKKLGAFVKAKQYGIKVGYSNQFQMLILQIKKHFSIFCSSHLHIYNLTIECPGQL